MRYPSDVRSNLAEILADLFLTRGDIVPVLDEAGIRAYRVNLGDDALVAWNDIVGEADRLGLLRALVAVARRRYPSGDAANKLDAISAALTAADVQRRLVADGKKNGTGRWMD